MALQTGAVGCPYCGGRLHRGDYPRKPRGGPPEPSPLFHRRFSFCCAREGCRRRTTPPSVRFFGRRVYLGLVVLLVGALRQGPDRWSTRRLRRLLGVSRSTLKRWRLWWLYVFPATSFWKLHGRVRFLPAVIEEGLPYTLLIRWGYHSDWPKGVMEALKFLRPITCRFGQVLCGA